MSGTLLFMQEVRKSINITCLSYLRRPLLAKIGSSMGENVCVLEFVGQNELSFVRFLYELDYSVLACISYEWMINELQPSWLLLVEK